MITNRNLRIYVGFLPITFILALLGIRYAHLGVLHYGSFIFGLFVIYDAIKTYQLKDELTIDVLLETMAGTFMISEHIYLFQAFLAGEINF